MKLSTIGLPILQLACLASAQKAQVPEPANPPPMPANVKPYVIPSDSGSLCEKWHHTFKNNITIGWCAGCKRLEKCGYVLTVEAVVCIESLKLFSEAGILACLVEAAGDVFGKYCFDGIC